LQKGPNFNIFYLNGEEDKPEAHEALMDENLNFLYSELYRSIFLVYHRISNDLENIADINIGYS